MGNWLQNRDRGGEKMIICIIVISILIMILLIKYFEMKKYNQQLLYICTELENMLKKGGHGPILLRTENLVIKRIMICVNHFLESSYEKEREFINKKQELQKMMTNISHDLKTPLTTLCGYIQLLKIRYQQNSNDAQNIKNIIEKLEKKAEQTNHRILQFLDIAKLESGDMEYKYQILDVNSLCKEIILEYYDILEMMGFTVELDMEEKAITVLSDRESLVCIIKNLIDNVLKYGADGKFLGIRVKEDGVHVVIEVEDHGKGILLQEQELVFHRDYKGQNAKKYSRNSTGLGLAISEKLAEQLMGKLYLTSTPEQKTIFALSLEKN